MVFGDVKGHGDPREYERAGRDLNSRPLDCFSSEASTSFGGAGLRKSQALYQAELPAPEHKAQEGIFFPSAQKEPRSFKRPGRDFHMVILNPGRGLSTSDSTGPHARPSYTTRARKEA